LPAHSRSKPNESLEISDVKLGTSLGTWLGTLLGTFISVYVTSIVGLFSKKNIENSPPIAPKRRDSSPNLLENI